MEFREFKHIIAAIIILTIVGGFSFIIEASWTALAQVFLFAVIIILVAVFAKKLIAYSLDAGVEHTIWQFSRWGYKPHQHLETPVPGGIIFPLFFALFSLGSIKFPALLTYEASALKRRAAKRFGFYSYTEMSDWHNALIGAAGIVAVLIIAIITYFLPANFEYLAKMAVYYAFANMIPIAKLDGCQIFFGSRVLYTVLAVITLIFFGYALIL